MHDDGHRLPPPYLGLTSAPTPAPRPAGPRRPLLHLAPPPPSCGARAPAARPEACPPGPLLRRSPPRAGPSRLLLRGSRLLHGSPAPGPRPLDAPAAAWWPPRGARGALRGAASGAASPGWRRNVPASRASLFPSCLPRLPVRRGHRDVRQEERMVGWLPPQSGAEQPSETWLSTTTRLGQGGLGGWNALCLLSPDLRMYV